MSEQMHFFDIQFVDFDHQVELARQALDFPDETVVENPICAIQERFQLSNVRSFDIKRLRFLYFEHAKERATRHYTIPGEDLDRHHQLHGQMIKLEEVAFDVMLRDKGSLTDAYIKAEDLLADIPFGYADMERAARNVVWSVVSQKDRIDDMFMSYAKVWITLWNSVYGKDR